MKEKNYENKLEINNCTAWKETYKQRKYIIFLDAL
jgi:hypothetical protein